LVEAGSADSALLIGGAREAGILPVPLGVESLTLPALEKSAGGDCRSRSLGVALDAYAPDVLVVDKHAEGFRGELNAGIERLRERHGARLVLGLREVLDDPATVRAEWGLTGTAAVVEDRYDRVWVYGDPRVYDPVHEYALGAGVAAKVRYTGYLAPRAPAHEPRSKLVVCVVGGGQDVGALGEAFVRAPLPAGMAGLLVTGPHMPIRRREAVRAVARRRRDMRVRDFVRDPQRLLARAERVVAMGGYNTVCEVLGAGRPGLVVPRERPRVEQLLRVERLAERGVVDVLRERALSPAAIGAWLARPIRPRPRPAEVIDLDGLERIPAMLDELLGHPIRRRKGSFVAA